MTKILKNKTFKCWFSILLAFLLVVTLAPSFQAFGTDEDGKTDITVQEEGSDLTVSGIPEDALETELPEVSDDVPADPATTDGNPSPDGENGDTLAAQGTDDQANPDEGISAQAEFWTPVPGKANEFSATVDGTKEQSLMLEEGKTYTLTVNGTLKGKVEAGQSNSKNTIYVPRNTTLTLLGAGTIEGTKQGSVIVVAGGAKLVVGNGTTGPTIKGGTGSKLDMGTSDTSGINDDHIFYGNPNVGGGILVKRDNNKLGATLTFNSGTVTNNNAQAGGGIYIDRNCSFTMNGGTVSNNTTVRAAAEVVEDPKENRGNYKGPHTDINAAHEGGGIYIAGQNARITKGLISGNTSQTTTDWGGGGIFVEVQGSLELTSVLVNANTARGLGGGVAGCPHAKTGIGNFGGESAIAIFGNSAVGQNWPNNKWLDKLGQKGDYLAKKDAGFTADKAMDYYCTYVSAVESQNYATNESFGWHGRLAHQNGTSEDVTIPLYDNSKKDQFQGIAVQDASLGLTAAMPSNVPSRSSYGVVIVDNTSWTHGGGIGLNGKVTIGKVPPNKTSENDAWAIELSKQYKKMNGALAELKGGEFAFGVYKDADCAQPVEIAGQAVTATNDAQGKIIFKLEGYPTGNKNNPQKLYIKEIVPAEADQDKNIAYDEKVHRVDVNIKEITTSINDPWMITTTNYEATVVGYYLQEENGSWTKTDEGATFVNKVKPTEDKKSVTNPWSIEVAKSFKSSNGQNLLDLAQALLEDEGLDAGFTFTLFEAKEGVSEDQIFSKEGAIDEASLTQIGRATNATSGENKGKARFNFVDDTAANSSANDDRIDATKYRNDPEGEDTESQTTYTFYVKEEKGANDDITYDEAWHKVQVTIKTKKDQTVEGEDTLKPIAWTIYTSSIESTQYQQYQKQEQGGSAAFEQEDAIVFNNIFHPKGEFVLNAQKNYYGATSTDDAAGKFHFSMTEVADGPENNKLVLPESLEENAVNGEFTGNKAQVTFPTITYEEKTGDARDHWYVLSETRSDIEGVELDPRYYVVKVAVEPAANGMSLTSKITEAYFAEGVTETQELFGGTERSLELTQIYSEAEGATFPTLEFSNFDITQTMSVAGYSVNAASNEPLEEVCFVDPKIVKNLEGRTLKADEFNFKLIHLNKDDNLTDDAVDWSSTEGPVISETSNDRYGMVDFDAANNVSGDWENPSCLSYTQPGIYHYRVVEANDTIDPSVEYSKQIITFTTVIEYNAQGQLECTDMYYGYVDGDGYHRYTSKADDPTYEASDNWHPTMTNTAKNMTLKVQKTSALDRNRGLEGATYGLYAVNEGVQDDILIGEQTSDKEGWITFEDLSLNTAATYYFKERYAPAGHTVSEFRSPYFKVAQGADGYKVVNIEEGAQAQSEDEGIRAMAEEDVAAPAAEEGITIFAEGVYDEATLVEFAKLDARTHEWVEGADLSIIKKSTGEVVNRWTSGKANQKLEGVLNIDTTYILRENAAPEGYAKADDVEFTIDSYGSVRVISGTGNNSAGLANAALQDSTISLYDTMLDAEQLVTQTRETPGQDDEGSLLAKTGDFLKIAGLIALMTASLLGLVYAIRCFRQGRA